MRRPEGVVYEVLPEDGEGGGQLGGVAGLAFLESGVLRHQDPSRSECAGAGQRLRPRRLGAEAHVLAEEFAQPRRDRFERSSRTRPASGTAQVGEEDQGRSGRGESAEGRQSALDAGVVRDPPAPQGDVEVHPHHYALSPARAEVVQGLLAHRRRPNRADSPCPPGPGMPGTRRRPGTSCARPRIAPGRPRGSNNPPRCRTTRAPSQGGRR